jgi:hypothetical protein
MAIPAICTNCGNQRTYPGTKGSKLSRTACAHCGLGGTLALAGRRPGARARAAIKVLGWIPKAAPGTRYVP